MKIKKCENKFSTPLDPCQLSEGEEICLNGIDDDGDRRVDQDDPQGCTYRDDVMPLPE